MGKYGTVGKTTHNSIIRHKAHGMLNKWDKNANKLTICDVYCFSTVIIKYLTRLSITAIRSLPLLLGLRYLTRLYAHSLESHVTSVICLSDKREFLRVLKIMYKFQFFVSCKRTYKTYDLILPTNFLFSVQTRKKLRAANKIFQICLSCVYIHIMYNIYNI
jgi:hypothetical protein